MSFRGLFGESFALTLVRSELRKERDDRADANDGDDSLGDHVRRVVARGVGEDRFDGGVRRVLGPDGGAADEVADVPDGADHDSADGSRNVRVLDDPFEHAGKAEERKGDEVVREHQDDVGENALNVTGGAGTKKRMSCTCCSAPPRKAIFQVGVISVLKVE